MIDRDLDDQFPILLRSERPGPRQRTRFGIKRPVHLEVLVSVGKIGGASMLFGIILNHWGRVECLDLGSPTARGPQLTIDVAPVTQDAGRHVRRSDCNLQRLPRLAVSWPGGSADDIGVARFRPTPDLVEVPERLQECIHLDDSNLLANRPRSNKYCDRLSRTNLERLFTRSPA